TAAARNIPFARFAVSPEQELPGALRAAGLSPVDVHEVVLTHHHGDHVDGIVHVPAPVRIHSEELAHASSTSSRVMRRVLRQPLPPGLAPTPFELDRGPFGGFPRSAALSADPCTVAVATPGHNPGHLSGICVGDA